MNQSRPLVQPFPAGLVDHVARVLAQFGRMGSTRTYRFPAITTALAGGGEVSQPVSITFRRDAIAVALYGSEISGEAAIYAQTEVRVQVSGQEDLVTDGQSGQFADYLALFAEGYYPLMRYVYTGQSWSAQYRNVQASAMDEATPSLYVAVCELEASPQMTGSR